MHLIAANNRSKDQVFPGVQHLMTNKYIPMDLPMYDYTDEEGDKAQEYLDYLFGVKKYGICIVEDLYDPKEWNTCSDCKHKLMIYHKDGLYFPIKPKEFRKGRKRKACDR